MNDYLYLLKKMKLFKGVEGKNIEEILNKFKHHRYYLNKNKVITIDQDNIMDVIFLLKGKLKAELISSYGKVIRLREIEAPNFLIPKFIVTDNSTPPLILTSLKNADLIYFKKRVFIKIIMNNEQLIENFIDITSNRFNFLINRLEFLHFNKIEKKLAYYLLTLKPDNSDVITFPMKIKELAEYFGVERPSLSKIIGIFVEQGIIEKISRDSVKIKNMEKLFAIIDD